MMGSGSHFIDNFYPFILLLLALSYTYPCFSSNSTTHLCLPEQRDALLRFMHSYNNTKINWDEHVDCCKWDGIFCDSVTGDVIHFDTYKSRINGTIENITYLLSPLYNLQDLSLMGNLSGVVPPALSHFSKLTSLYITPTNQELAMESHSLKLLVQNLTQLEMLDLGGVKIHGDLSNALMNVSTTLKGLSLGGCNLKGKFPESVFQLPNLRYLDLGSNLGLTVSLPTFNWTSPLEHLYLYSTNFSGKLPDSIGNLKNLKYLDMNSCYISSLMPSSIGNLTRLVFLSLSSFAHKGAIPSSICRLSSLNQLFLPRNKFRGMIPQCLGNLTNLWVLDLSANQLTGSFPSLANSTQLGYLNVSDNMINDSITHSVEFPSKLSVIDLRANNFHGEIPSWICRSTPYVVDLSKNSFTGTIPPCLINYTIDGHKVLNLRMNKLAGTIPDTFPEFCPITVLDLSENRLEGLLPRSIVNCKNLTIIELGNNNIEDFFPSWLETLPKLQILVLKSNKLYGEVNTLLNHHPFPSLRIFDISNNNLIGLLPTEYIAQFDAMRETHVSEGISLYLEDKSLGVGYRYSTTITMKGSILILPKVLNALKLIDFSNNNFHGKIPEIIGDLLALKGLNLSHNNLIGNIPPSIQSMTNLEWLDLSSNKLTGRIPSELTQLTALEFLNLSHNELTGMIPEGKQFDTFGMDAFAGNAGLCGSQIAMACGKPDNPQSPPLPSIAEDEFDFFSWKIILVGYGCGLVIGSSIGYIVLELRKPEWLVSLFEEKMLNKVTRLRRRTNRPRRT